MENRKSLIPEKCPTCGSTDIGIGHLSPNARVFSRSDVYCTVRLAICANCGQIINWFVADPKQFSVNAPTESKAETESSWKNRGRNKRT